MSTYHGLILALAGAAISLPVAAGPVEDARAAVVGKLKDPGSADFRGVFERENAICGEVNAKNSLGGYSGFQRFYYVKSMKSAFVQDRGGISSDPLDSIARGYDSFCK